MSRYHYIRNIGCDICNTADVAFPMYVVRSMHLQQYAPLDNTNFIETQILFAIRAVKVNMYESGINKFFSGNSHHII